MDTSTNDRIDRILNIVMEILETVRFIKDHNSLFEGDPMLEFPEVCERLKQSERQVRRLRESGELVGFTIGRRRMYLQSEVDAFIERSRKAKSKNSR